MGKKVTNKNFNNILKDLGRYSLVGSKHLFTEQKIASSSLATCAVWSYS